MKFLKMIGRKLYWLFMICFTKPNVPGENHNEWIIRRGKDYGVDTAESSK